ncbi:activator-dependent family glycosyltransferase [Streptomyces oceani]|uniref:Glycosyl transferase n=1 Tax=Streptomyces oceani TaxID=1075402 RepID=A0A1E7JVV5_9ACTN|nr:activator-dependent family glycosyltransferase [Streptomyces oceani]OEU94839.1 glycosyl transferase [Streptomyces oceani]
MRVLLTVNPEKNIFMYLVPLAWSLRTAGHEVLVASQPRFADTITQAGLTAVPVGGDFDKWQWGRQAPELLESIRPGLTPPWDVAEDPEGTTWEHTLQSHKAAVEGAHEGEAAAVIDDLVAFAHHWKPDLVVWDSFSYIGPITAKACGAAHARVVFGADVFGTTRDIYQRLKAQQPEAEREDPLADWLGGHARRFGAEFSEDMTTGHVTIDQFPPSLQLGTDRDVLQTQFIGYGGPAVVPEWLKKAPERPRVGMTLGLTATEVFNGYNIPLSEIFDSVAELDVELVATIAQSQQEKLGNVPDNVRLVPYVPWHAIAPTCSAVIHHAGAATLATTARHPVPQLSLHFHFDQPILARKLAEQGAGLEIHTTQATGQNIRESVHRLLTEPRFVQQASALRDEILGAPSLNELVPRLEEVAVKYRAG